FDEFVGFPVGHLGYYFDAWFLHNDEEKQSSGYTSDYFTGQAIDFMERNRENPFLCYVSYNVPHSPFQVPEEYFSKYRQAGLDSTLSSVYGMVENMDYNIGQILAKLEQLKIAENTIVIFFSDNGPNTDRYNGGMKGRKGAVDEGGVRVPFYIKWPERIKPSSTAQLAQSVDIMPTLIGLCGLNYDPEKPFDGIDLSGIIKGKQKTFDRLIFSRQGNQILEECNSSVRNNTYRLVLTRRDTLLYNLNDDPRQLNDISSAEKETTSSLLDQLVRHNEELISNYQPVTTIEAGFREENSFTLPVQDAALSGKIRYSSIHPNQSHTESWIQDGDSIVWSLNIVSDGTYKVALQYGCTPAETGSRMELITGSGVVSFMISEPFESEVLPERDYVKRSESVERTWSWMDVGTIALKEGKEKISLKLVSKSHEEAGLIKSLRFSRIYNQ
ncbi:MAG: sulfatase-like hydrolase/transferase, partial [Bacteroidales bacterium]|nr:sulfatase-like hydrolase/transferase [Bacteroidales bacterium]